MATIPLNKLREARRRVDANLAVIRRTCDSLIVVTAAIAAAAVRAQEVLT